MNKKAIKRTLKVVFILASISSLYFVPWLLVKAWILPLPNSVQEQLDEAVGHGFDGVIAYIDRAGVSPQLYSSGWHNRELEELANTDALFKIASISKLYDAVAVTKLVNDDRLSFDNTLVEYLPELSGRVEFADEITLRMLIQHKSGIPNFTDVPGFWAAPTQSYEESLALILDQPANFKPGEDYEYNNTNYLLLNRIMDNELGFGNFQFIREEILNPLNLNNTFSSLSEVNIDRVMSGYHLGYPHDLKGNDFGMHATAEDVGIFLRALNDGSLFDGQERDLYASAYETSHSGWVPGYQSFAIYDSNTDTVVVVFYSTTDPDLYYWNLSQIINNRIIKILNRSIEP